MTTILDGKTISEKIINDIKNKITFDAIKLSIILVGNNSSSQTYIKMKQKKCQEVGIITELIEFKEDEEYINIIKKIEELNNKNETTGILIQLPLPNKLESETQKILDTINPLKDVDGLSTYWLGKNFVGNEEIISCTPKGVIRLIDEYDIELEGKTTCIIGTSNLVGKPLGILCLNRKATVTYTNIHTIDLKKHTINADIIISCTGVPHLITADMIKENSIIIDVGFSKIKDKVVGDIDFENVSKKASYITPVPGGVGPMTIAMLIENLIILNTKQKKGNKNE